MIQTPDPDRRGAMAWMAHNRVAPNLFMLVLIIGGFLTSLRIKQEIFPDFEMDQVTVQVQYPGSSPEEVEEGIVLAIEEAVMGLEGVDEVTSVAREGMGSVTIELLTGEDLQKLAQDVQNEVDRIVSFPEDIEEPEVSVVARRREVVSVMIYGQEGEKVLRNVAELVRDELLQDPKITLCELSAVRDLEISIEVPEDTLRAYNLTLDQVAQKVRAAAVEVPGGGLKTRGGEILVRMKEKRDYGIEFADIPIVCLNDGTVVHLGEIATIIDGFEDNDFSDRYNGEPAARIDVYRVGDQTPIQVSDAVHERLKIIRANLPGGVKLGIWDDHSELYRQRLELLLRNAAMGLALVFAMLTIFLETRLAFWVSMGIPISFLGAILFLSSMDISINMISMFAFIVALGIVVDDAIVVGENIYEWRSQGMPFLQAAVRGAREVMMPVTFSILTNVVTFMPLAFIPGVMGKIWWTIPAVVITVFMISLFESLLILPCHLGHQRQRHLGPVRGFLHNGQQRFSAFLARMIRVVYGPILDTTLRYRYLAVGVGLAVLATTSSYVASGRMGMSMFPRVESDEAVATAVLPYGSAVEMSEAVQKKLRDAADRVVAAHGGKELAQAVYSAIGHARGSSASGSHVTQVRVYLTEPERRPITTAQLVDLWRKEVGAIAGLESLKLQSDLGGPGSGAALTIELSHRDLGVLEAASDELADALRRFPNTMDVEDGFIPGKRQYDFHILPAGESLGLTASSVARQVRNAYYGAEVLRQQRGRNEVKVMVRLPKKERIHEYDLEELLLRTPAGKEIPLREAVRVERGRAYTTIDRRQGRRVVSVTSDVNPPSQAGQIQQTLEEEILPKLMAKYPGLAFGYEGKQADMAESMGSLKGGFAIAMLVVYALLAIPLRSYIQPAIIMTSIPFGLIGAVIGHLIMGYSMSVMSMMGIVALAGVVVNDALVLIDFANREYQAGKSAFEAMHSAGVRRFRPILLTSLTTFGGLAPMIFETSRQARFLIPMALSLGFGILFATFITLLLVPCLFLIVEDGRRFSAWLRGSEAALVDAEMETATPS